MIKNDVFLTGGSGFVGSRFIEIYSRNLQITALQRITPVRSKSVTPIEGDLIDLDSLVKATRGCKTIVHIGGSTPNRAYRDGHYKATIIGTKNLIQAARINGIERFIFISSSCATHDSGPYAQSKVSAENDVVNSGLKWTIFRPTIIIGSGGKDFGRMLHFWSKARLIPLIGDGQYFKQPIFVDDLCKVIVESIENRDALSRIVNVAGPDAIRFNLFITAFADGLGNKHFSLIHLPVSLITPLSLIARSLNPKWGLNPERVKIITRSNILEITPFKNLLCTEPTRFKKMAQITIDRWKAGMHH